LDEMYEVESNGWGLIVVGGLTFYGAKALFFDILDFIVAFLQ